MDSIRVLTAKERGIPAAGVLRLYEAAGWWPERTADDVAAVIASFPAVGAWRGRGLVGFARAVTDGRFRAYLEDVVVDPTCRRQGVGSALVRRLEELLAGVRLVSLFTGTDLTPFYQSAGYRPTRQVVLHRRLTTGG